MGFATHSLDLLRKIGRSYVLPAQEIQTLLEQNIPLDTLECILDFGAGTLFWSEFFAAKMIKNSSSGGGVIALDSIYKTYTPPLKYSNITCLWDLDSMKKEPDMFFASDVLHHLNLKAWQNILHNLTSKTRYVVIKDIDATHRFGNFANAMHDLLINGERVRSIYPHDLARDLEELGYHTQYFYIPKLWYPHFLLIAKR